MIRPLFPSTCIRFTFTVYLAGFPFCSNQIPKMAYYVDYYGEEKEDKEEEEKRKNQETKRKMNNKIMYEDEDCVGYSTG